MTFDLAYVRNLLKKLQTSVDAIPTTPGGGSASEANATANKEEILTAIDGIVPGGGNPTSGIIDVSLMNMDAFILSEALHSVTPIQNYNNGAMIDISEYQPTVGNPSEVLYDIKIPNTATKMRFFLVDNSLIPTVINDELIVSISLNNGVDYSLLTLESRGQWTSELSFRFLYFYELDITELPNTSVLKIKLEAFNDTIPISSVRAWYFR